jgi:hypothetical protein
MLVSGATVVTTLSFAPDALVPLADGVEPEALVAAGFVGVLSLLLSPPHAAAAIAMISAANDSPTTRFMRRSSPPMNPVFV